MIKLTIDDVDKPVFTQAMSTIGVTPEAGMLCRVKQEWLFIGVNYAGNWVLESTDTDEIKAFNPKHVKPVKTEQEKLIDELVKRLGKSPLTLEAKAEYLTHHFNITRR